MRNEEIDEMPENECKRMTTQLLRNTKSSNKSVDDTEQNDETEQKSN